MQLQISIDWHPFFAYERWVAIVILYRVATCTDCKMPASNLAKVFGPTVIGYSVPNPEPMQMINETKKQAMVRNAI